MFFAFMSRLRFIERWSTMRKTKRENVLEHTAQVAMLVHALALLGNEGHNKTYDPSKLATYALYHDADEVLTGDLPTPVKYHNPQMREVYALIETDARARLLKMLPEDLQSHYEPLISSHLDEDEAKLLKAADRLAAYLKCLEERSLGNGDFSSAEREIRGDLEALKLPEVEDFLETFAEAFTLNLDELSGRER